MQHDVSYYLLVPEASKRIQQSDASVYDSFTFELGIVAIILLHIPSRFYPLTSVSSIRFWMMPGCDAVDPIVNMPSDDHVISRILLLAFQCRLKLVAQPYYTTQAIAARRPIPPYTVASLAAPPVEVAGAMLAACIKEIEPGVVEVEAECTETDELWTGEVDDEAVDRAFAQREDSSADSVVRSP